MGRQDWTTQHEPDEILNVLFTFLAAAPSRRRRREKFAFCVSPFLLLKNNKIYHSRSAEDCSKYKTLLRDKFPPFAASEWRASSLELSTSKSFPELICIPMPSPEVLCAVQLKEYFSCFFLISNWIEMKKCNLMGRNVTPKVVNLPIANCHSISAGKYLYKEEDIMCNKLNCLNMEEKFISAARSNYGGETEAQNKYASVAIVQSVAANSSFNLNTNKQKVNGSSKMYANQGRN